MIRGAIFAGGVPIVLLSGIILSSCEKPEEDRPTFGLAVHGGAGTILRENMTQEKEDSYREEIGEGLSLGYRILEEGGTSLDAVEAVVTLFEDSPLFNAGKGAVFTNEGTNELDASIMDGRTLMAGAVGAVSHIRNPVKLARLVMERSPHVLLVGKGAENFAKEMGVELVPRDYFYTERRWKQWQKRKEKQNANSGNGQAWKRKTVFGTVGAVALDKNGNLAAATSTGGLTNKRFGRVGDSPIIGAGTYANNASCAVSGTGEGEYFMRGLVTHDISALLSYGNKPLKEAARIVIMEKLTERGGRGGVIAIDGAGEVAMTFNTEGMYRGFRLENRDPVVKIYEE